MSNWRGQHPVDTSGEVPQTAADRTNQISTGQLHTSTTTELHAIWSDCAVVVDVFLQPAATRMLPHWWSPAAAILTELVSIQRGAILPVHMVQEYGTVDIMQNLQLVLPQDGPGGATFSL